MSEEKQEPGSVEVEMSGYRGALVLAGDRVVAMNLTPFVLLRRDGDNCILGHEDGTLSVVPSVFLEWTQAHGLRWSDSLAIIPVRRPKITLMGRDGTRQAEFMPTVHEIDGHRIACAFDPDQLIWMVWPDE